MICDPYPRLLVARDHGRTRGAAATVDVGGRPPDGSGVPEEKWVYLRGHADQTEQDLLDRRRRQHQPLGETGCGRSASGRRNRASTTSRPSTCTAASRSPSSRCATRVGLAADDPRGFTTDRRAAVLRRPRQQLLPARYRRDRCRDAGRSRARSALVGANGGVDEQVLGRRVYSTEPADWATGPQQGAAGTTSPRCRRWPSPATPTGPPPSGDLLGALRLAGAPASSSARLDADDSRFMARHHRRRPGGVDERRGDPIGACIEVKFSTDDGNFSIRPGWPVDLLDRRRQHAPSLWTRNARGFRRRGA